MARITIEDCLKRVSNRFLLVNMVPNASDRSGKVLITWSVHRKMKMLSLRCAKLLPVK